MVDPAMAGRPGALAASLVSALIALAGCTGPAHQVQETRGSAAPAALVIPPPALTVADASSFFVEPEARTTLRWESTGPGSGPLPYAVHGMDGSAEGVGLATWSPDGRLELSRAFAQGWHEVRFPASGQAFGVVAIEAQAGPVDPFFGIDAALSWLETDPGRRTAMVRVFARCGLALARERMGLETVPADPAGDWDRPPRCLDAMRSGYAALGFPLLEILTGAAQRHHPVAEIPTDLVALAATHRAVAGRWQTGWAAVEAGNEPDLKPIPADLYAGVVKTASWSLRRAGCPAPLVAGVFAHIPPGPYFDACAANGVLEDADAISFHTYDRADALEGIVTRYRTWLAAAGHPDLPLWVSECGWPWAKGPARAPQEADLDSACEIAAKAVESRACGIARHFPFVAVFYEEGPKNFGMTGRDGTPLRSMAAYAACVRALAGRRYVGDLRGVGGAAKRARVFAGEGAEAVAVLYAGPPAAGACAALPVPALRIAGLDGRALVLREGTVPLDDGLAYAWCDRAALAAYLDCDTPAMRLRRPGAAAAPRRASPIILQLQGREFAAGVSARRYLVGQDAACTLPVRVRIWNLAPDPMVVRPALALPGGAPQPAAAVTIPGSGSLDLAWTVDATAALDISATRLVTVTASADGVVPPAPLAIPLVMEGTLEQHLARHAHRRSLPIDDLARWQSNCKAGGASTFAAVDGRWTMRSRYPGSDWNWDFPKFTLDRPIDPTREDAFLIRARILEPARPACLLANPNQPDGFWCRDLFPADGAWHVVHVPFAELAPGPGGVGMQNTRLDPASWRVLALGMHSSGPVNSLEISDFLVVGDGGSARP